MKKLGVGVGALLALFSGACSDDSVDDGAGGSDSQGQTATTAVVTGATTDGAGGGNGEGGRGEGGGGGAASCYGTESTDEKLSQALDLLRSQLVELGAPGGAIAVVQDGQLVGVGVAGSKRSGFCDPVTTETLFKTGFQSHWLTTLAALDAVEDGSLELDAPIVDVAPTLTASDASNGDVRDITLRHLLTRSSMYRSESDDQGDYICTSLADAYANPVNPVVQAPPGSMVDHDDRSNMEIVGLALENVDGMPFADVVAARVLGPLGMGGSYDAATIEASDHAVGLAGTDTDIQDCPNREPSHGYFGSIDDMAKLVTYMMAGAGDVLEPAMLETMTTPQGPAFFSDSYSTFGGQGWSMDGAEDFVTANSNGWGFGDVLAIYKERGLAVFVMVNLQPANLGPLTEGIARIYDPSVPGLDETTLPADPASFPSLVGTYRDDLGFHGITERTLSITLDPDDSERLVGTISGPDASPEPVALETNIALDNFTMTYLGNTYPVRFWREDADVPYAISLFSDNGPPFFRVE